MAAARLMLGETNLRWALAISLLLHAGLAAAHLRDRGQQTRRIAPLTDAWAGRTFEIEPVFAKPTAPNTNAPVQARAGPATAGPMPEVRPAATAMQPVIEEPQAATKPILRAPSAPPASSEEREAKAEQEPDPSAGAASEYGAEGLPPGVRRLAKAFTRAIPAAIGGDPLWSHLPLGSAGTLRVAIVIDADGRIASAELLDGEPPPADHLQHLLERTVALLKSGRFALNQSQTNAGTEVLRLEASISQRQPSDGYEPGHVLYKGNEEPQARKPGKAFFTLASGRHIEVKVTIERSSG